VVIAFGGYLSFSYVLTSRILKVPVILHEANRKAGKSIRSLSRLADLVYLPEGVFLKGVVPGKLRRIGMPLRREVHHIKKDKIREQLAIPLHVKVLTVVGGSQGALALNEWVEHNVERLARDGIWMFLVAGPGKQTLPEHQVFESDQGQPVEVRTFAFHNALHELFSASDIVISRAGAGTIAELIHCLTPSILVPYPFAADQHQLANANYLEKRGGCIVLSQNNLTSLYREVQDLIYNDALLAKMRKNLSRLGLNDPAEIICSAVIEHHMHEPVELLERGAMS
jgi:UDP-N-acetylglucosamine--N-acetylmuramyl-(pentapeptide) pyrophosphoryl-undecaprenol N-acetylglucosamine transferase